LDKGTDQNLLLLLRLELQLLAVATTTILSTRKSNSAN